MSFEMPNPFRRDVLVRPRSAAGVNPRDLARLYLIGVVFIFVLVAMVVLGVYARKKPREAALRPDEIRYREAAAEDGLARRARRLAADLPEAAPPFEGAAYAAVLEFVRKDMTPEGVSQRAQQVPPPLLVEDARARRGQFVLMHGRPEGFAEGGAGTLVTHPHGTKVALATTEPLVPAENEWWEVEGLFLGLANDRRPAVLARNVRIIAPPKTGQEAPAPPPTAVQTRSIKELAQEFLDDKDSIHLPVEKDAQGQWSKLFLEIMSAVRNTVTPEGAAQAALPNVTPDDLLRDPAKHRGETVRMRGRLVRIITENLNVTNPDHVTEIYWASMLSHPQTIPIHFYMAEKPAATFDTYLHRGELFYRDWIEVEGVFLRLYRYEGKTLEGEEGPVHTAPVLFVKNLRVVPAPQFKDPRLGFALMVIGFGVGIAAVVIVAGVMSRRYGRRSLRMQMASLRRDKATAEGKPAFPAPSPEKQVLGDEVKPPS